MTKSTTGCTMHIAHWQLKQKYSQWKIYIIVSIVKHLNISAIDTRCAQNWTGRRGDILDSYFTIFNAKIQERALRPARFNHKLIGNSHFSLFQQPTTYWNWLRIRIWISIFFAQIRIRTKVTQIRKSVETHKNGIAKNTIWVLEKY